MVMTKIKKKKVIFKGAKGERIEVDLTEHDAVKHHNRTVNVKSGAWNEKNFSNDPNKVYNGRGFSRISLKSHKILDYLVFNRKTWSQSLPGSFSSNSSNLSIIIL